VSTPSRNATGGARTGSTSTVRTERNHVAGVLGKLGVHSKLQAVLFAVRYGVIKLR
jgi:DNA-binding NarL/FixJ family response regulator